MASMLWFISLERPVPWQPYIALEPDWWLTWDNQFLRLAWTAVRACYVTGESSWAVVLLVSEKGQLLEVDVLDSGSICSEIPDPAVSQIFPPHRLQVKVISLSNYSSYFMLLSLDKPPLWHQNGQAKRQPKAGKHTIIMHSSSMLLFFQNSMQGAWAVLLGDNLSWLEWEGHTLRMLRSSTGISSYIVAVLGVANTKL